MKNISTSLLFHGLVAAAVWSGSLHAPAAETAPKKTAAASAAPVVPVVPPVPVVPVAVFADDSPAGKDPFHPNSTRRHETVVRVAPATKTAPVANRLNTLSLKGISGLDGQKLALINGSTLAQGEFAEIRLSGQLLKIRCREIRERSVVVELEGGGEVRELKLRDGI